MDPEDPTVIAENELLGAAASIDAAAKKLASLRPRKSLQVSTSTTFLFSSFKTINFHLNSAQNFRISTNPSSCVQ